MEQKTEVEIRYLQRDLTILNDRFLAFMDKHEKQMDNLALAIASKEGLFEEKFIKKTELSLMFKNLELEMKGINSVVTGTMENFNAVIRFIPMLEKIEDERDDMKRIIMNWVSQGLLTVVSIVSGYLFLKKK